MIDEPTDTLFSEDQLSQAPNHTAKPIMLIALGGNALIGRGQKGTIDEQFENLKVPLEQIAQLSRKHRLIITHGNGPQVGNLLLQQECCDKVPKLPLEILVAQTQGQIGYMIESTLDSELMRLGIVDKAIVCLITYVVVDEKDPAFDEPSKPIGPTYSEQEINGANYPYCKTAQGYRRVVASPQPKTIVEHREIKSLIDMDYIVICCGGGGIPVTRGGRTFLGMNAVIDKDLASAKLAEEVGVDIMVIATDVEGVAINYGQENQQTLQKVTIDQMQQYLDQGQFPPGSMGPKVQAALRFMQNGGRRAIITSTKNLAAAIAGETGTEIIL